MSNKLIYICGDIQLKDQALKFLDTTREEVITIQSNIASDLQPFGSVVKSILYSAYKKNVTDIFIVVSRLEEDQVHENEMRSWLFTQGIDKEAFEVYDYLEKYSQSSLYEWLAVSDVEKTVNKNIRMLRSHPFLPKKLTIRGLILNENNQFTVVE